jgi:hypothetical protein
LLTGCAGRVALPAWSAGDVISSRPNSISRRQLLVAYGDTVRGMIRVPFTKGHFGLIELEVAFDERGAIPAFLDLGAQQTFTNVVTANWIEGGGRIDPERSSRGLTIGHIRWDQFSVIVEDLQIFAYWIRADELAVILGADLFRDRALVLAYQDSALFVAR